MANKQFDDESTRLINPVINISLNIDKVQNGKQFLCASVALVAALSMGFSLGYSSTAIPSMKDEGIITTDDEASWFGSLLTIGAIAGGPVAGFFLDVGGRKLTIMLCAVPYVAGWVSIATVNGISGLYSGRILTGLAVGMSTLATPVYIAEMASPNMRGVLGSGFQLLLSTGILLAYALGILLNYKYLALIGATFAAVLITMMSLMPDTPRYLLIKGRRDRALHVLEWLRGPEVDVEIECREIEDALSNQESFSVKEFLKPSLYKPLLMSVSIMFFQQWSGVNAVTFNTVEIFQTAAPSIDPNVCSVIVGAVQVLASFVATLLMDKAGRRMLLIIAGIGMAISSTTFGLYYKLTDNSSTHSALGDLSWLSLTSMTIYGVAFSLGWGPVPVLIMSEIFPSKARGAATAIVTAFNWVFAFSVTKLFFGLKKENIFGEDGVFWLFAGVCAAGVIFVTLFVPETKGLALEEIEANFVSRSDQDNNLKV